jgi:hypothetical protein
MEIGKDALKFFDAFVENSHDKYNYIAIAGILSLRKKYTDKAINDACLRAYTFGALKYKIVKNICEKGLENLPVNNNISYLNEEETDMLRSLNEYTKLLN